MCRRERDAYIYSSIKEWEIEKVKQISDEQLRQNYIKGLEDEKRKVTQMFEKTP